jgi:hypothetical protein
MPVAYTGFASEEASAPAFGGRSGVSLRLARLLDELARILLQSRSGGKRGKTFSLQAECGGDESLA